MNLDNPLKSVRDHIDSFISSDTESDTTEFSDTLDVFDNVYKNINCQKLKGILLKKTCVTFTKRNKAINKSTQSR